MSIGKFVRQEIIDFISASWSPYWGDEIWKRSEGDQSAVLIAASESYAKGSGSVSFGFLNSASGDFSLSHGVTSLAIGTGSHAEGISTTSSGDFSHAEGSASISFGIASHAGGLHTIASGNFQTSVGRYNIHNNIQDFFVVGDGTADNARSNALGVGLYGAEYLFYASNSIYFPDLSEVSKPHVVVFDVNTKQIFYTASAGMGGGGSGTAITFYSGSTLLTSNLSGILITGSGVSASVNASNGVTMSFSLGTPITPVPGAPLNSIQFNFNNTFSGSARFTFISSSNQVFLTGSMIISGSAPTSSLTLFGSGSNYNTFRVLGTQGDLFSVTDLSSGSLWSVNDISGLPIIDVFSDNTVLLGDPIFPGYHTSNYVSVGTASPFKLGLIPTSSYDAAFFECVVKSGSSLRAESIVATWSGSTVVSSSNLTANTGNAADASLFVAISSSFIVLSGSTLTNNWIIKSIIRAI